jgi:hypothetical protein
MVPFKLTIHGREDFDVEAYEPCEGATFVVHRSRGGKDWLVTHRGTTWIAHQPDINTRTAALHVAQRLHDGCPSAAKVRVNAGGKRLVGPHQKMRDEIIAVLKSVGESLPRAA